MTTSAFKPTVGSAVDAGRVGVDTSSAWVNNGASTARVVRNDGTYPLVVSGIEVPAGWTATLATAGYTPGVSWQWPDDGLAVVPAIASAVMPAAATANDCRGTPIPPGAICVLGIVAPSGGDGAPPAPSS